MEVIILKDQKEAAQLGAKIISDLLRAKPELTLGLATGSTSLSLYKELIQLHQKTGLDFSKVTTFNLDEYVGLPSKHPSSYYHYMWENFFQHVNISEYRVHIPDGLAPDIPAFCKQYEASIMAAGGIEIQILGIGSDGHIGFNEPSSSPTSRTRIKTLTRQTINNNKKFFNTAGKVPRHVITMGIGTIMEAEKIILFAYGESKADAIKQTIEGPITSMVPASILQLHPKSILIIDDSAASRLDKADYYKWIYANKPDWQKY